MAQSNVFTAFAQPVKSVQDYDDERAARELGRLNLQEKRRANQLSELTVQQQTADRSTLQRLAQESGGDENKLIAALRGSGSSALMDMGSAREKAMLDRRKTEADVGKTSAETLAKQLDAMKFLSTGVMANPSPQNAALAIDAFERMTGRQMPEERQKLAVLQTPEQVRQWAAGHSLQADQLLPKLQSINAGGAMVQQAIDPLTGRASETGRTTITQSADNAATQATARANNQASMAVQMRGQNMANERARDANMTQRELLIQEKGLKIAELQEQANARARAKDANTAAIQNQIAVIDKALDHPGRSAATGLSGTIDPRNYVPGTDATDFRAVLDQIGGSAFLQAFESLKGGGAITEMEGKKASDAIARLNRTQSDSEFEVALNDLRQVMADGYKRISGKEYVGRSGVASKPAQTKSGATASNW